MRAYYAKFILASMVMFLGLVPSAIAVTYTTLSAGVWSTDGNNPCGCTPSSTVGSGTSLIITFDVSIPGPFTVDNGGLLTVKSGVLTITGGLTNGSVTFKNGSSVVVDAGAGFVVSGSFENRNSSDNVTFNGAVSIAGSFKNGTGGSGSAKIYVGSTGTIKYNGGCDNAGWVYDASGTGFQGCDNGPLPVKLLYFRGEQKGADVLLNWATATQHNFSYFAIERADEQLSWTEIGQLKGTGDSKVRNDYAFTDDYVTTIGKIYYRLKAVDLDGYTEYFNIIAVDYAAPKAWFVAPNPATSGRIILNRNFADEQPVVAVFYAVNGPELYREQFTFKSGQHVFNTYFKPGVYILALTTGTTAKRIKLVVE